MPQFHPNNIISDCWSSVGNITFYHRDGKCYWRTKPNPVCPGTLAQVEHQQVHLRALAAWRSISDDDREKWQQLAASVPAHRPPFFQKNNIVGHNLFVSAYHGFYILGDEHVPTPLPFVPFPGFSVAVVGAEHIGSGQLALRVRMTIYGSNTPMRYALLGKIQFSKPGYSYRANRFRNYLAQETEEETSSNGYIRNIRELVFFVPEPTNLDFQLHIRYLLLDRVTGYRSNYQYLSITQHMQ